MGKYYTLRFFKYCIWLMFCHMYRQILLPWQMLLPMFCGRCCCLGRCYCHIYYIILSDRCYSHFVITLADVIALWYVIDVKTTIVACYNSWWAGVICQVADGIATIGWMCMLDGISLADETAKGSVQFSLSSEVLNKTSSYICDRWNLPMFLLRDGLLTLINNVSWIALLRFWSSLPTILKLSMVMLWPVVLKWSNIGRVPSDVPWTSLQKPLRTLQCIPHHNPTYHICIYRWPHSSSRLDLGLWGPPRGSWWCCLL